MPRTTLSTNLLRQQESLSEIIESISSELELRPLLTLIVRRACDLLGADNGTIGLVDEQRNVVRSEATHRMPFSELGTEAPPGVGLFGLILRDGQPVIRNRYGELPEPIQLEYLENAVIGVPIFWRDRIIGAFGLGSLPPRRFTEEDVEVLSLFARHAAIAIVNAQLFAEQQRSVERHTIINRISRQITHSLDLTHILQTAVETLESHLQYSNIAVLLLDPDERETLVLRARSGLFFTGAPTEYRQSIRVGVIGAAVQSRQSILIPDVQRDPRYVAVPGVEGIYAELAVPLVAGERLLGVLNIESRTPIAADTVSDLGIIADQLSVAIDNAHRYQEEKRRTQRLELIARVGHRIAARLDPDELFTATLHELYTQLAYDHVSFFLLDQADPTWLEQRAFASRWPDAGRIGYRQSIDHGIVGAAARRRIPILVNDVRADPRYIPVSDNAGLLAELAVPILLGERLLGVLDVASRQPFAEDDVKAIQIVADQLAVAIEHTYLFADTQRALAETELLYQTSQRMSVARDVTDVVQTYLEQVAARGRYACSIALYEVDEQNQRRAIHVRGQWTPAEGIRCPLDIRLPYSQDALDSPLDAGQAIMIADVHSDPRVSPQLRQIQELDQRPALAMIPLVVRGQRIGLVILSYPAVHEWQQAAMHPYQITAAQLAMAIYGRQQQARIASRDRQFAVLEERRRLARDLHDSVTQLLFSITLIAQSVGSAWRRSSAEGEQRLQRLLELSQAALAEMRALLIELRPPEQSLFQSTSLPQPVPPPSIVQVHQEGLAAALRSHLKSVGHDGLQIELDTAAYQRQPTELEETLFRVAQEALNNIVKHSKATQVQIRLMVGDGFTRMTVRDNGSGFDLNDPSGRTGMGLQSMRERTTAQGGELQIRSAPGQGATVEVVLPMLGISHVGD